MQARAIPRGVKPVVWLFQSLVAAASYASGKPYTPLAKNATEQYVAFDVVAWKKGTFKLTVIYAMSTSESNNVVLECDYHKSAVGEDPNGALSTQSSFTLTPGTGTTQKSVGQDTQATLGIAVNEGDALYVKLTRKNSGSDTHTGSFNVIAIQLDIS